jgi:glycolate oxidase FAD binding subunit
VTETLNPTDENSVQEAVASALGDAMPLEIVGGGTKRALGWPVAARRTLSLAGLAGITLYEPEELVLTAHAGTNLAEIEQALSEQNQCLAFEPPDWRGLLRTTDRDQTIGGIVAANLAGPRRLQVGAVRDHFLGARMVTGRGEIVKIGGRVVKNVTGYDLCKLLAGSFGTLAVLTEITLKILPAAEKTRTVLVFGLEAEAAQNAMTAALSSPNEVSAAAHLPADIASRSAIGYVAGAGSAVTALRIEGLEPSVEARCASLREAMGVFGEVAELHFHNSRKFWQEVGDVSSFAGDDRPVWRLSVPPAGAPSVIAAIRQALDIEHFVDWGGGLVWLRIGGIEKDAGAAIIRNAIAPDGGHATLIRAPEEMRSRVPVFQPQPDALTRLTGRIKDGYDPAHILNPGRMVAGPLASGV